MAHTGRLQTDKQQALRHSYDLILHLDLEKGVLRYVWVGECLGCSPCDWASLRRDFGGALAGLGERECVGVGCVGESVFFACGLQLTVSYCARGRLGA